MAVKTQQASLLGKGARARSEHFSGGIDYGDYKIAFFTRYCSGKDTLDLGCVHHNPENYKSKYWLHGALKEVSRSLVGVDLYEEGVEYLRERGFDVVWGDAQAFELGRKFDVIAAGDLIEHLEDFHGFFRCCRAHLRPGGRLLISTPNPWYWRRTVKALLYREFVENPEHTCWFCPGTLRHLAARHGFEIDELRFGSRRFKDRIMPLPRGWRHMTFSVALGVP